MATVKEIIEKLKTMPQDMQVYTFCCDESLKPDDIVIMKDWPLGDPANPECKYETVVYIR